MKTKKQGDGITPERLSRYYNYNANLSAADLTAKYFIRFNEEWPGEIDENVKDYVIKAHGYLGDYEIYKYGLDADKRRERSPIQAEAMTTADFRPLRGKWRRTRTFIGLKMQTAGTGATRR